jgi:hypothetical protein
MNIKIVIETGEDGYVVAHVPPLKSCWSQGRLVKRLWKTFGKKLILTWSLSQTRYETVK